MKEIDGVLNEPVEDLVIDVPEDFVRTCYGEARRP